jgi:hypothetical protein
MSLLELLSKFCNLLIDLTLHCNGCCEFSLCMP